MAEMLKIIVDGKEMEFTADATFGDVAVAQAIKPEFPALGAIMNNKIYSMRETLPGAGTISFIDITHEEGSRIYARSASFILIRAVRELFEGAQIWIDHSINRSLYCKLSREKPLAPCELKAIEARMRAIVERNEPFVPVQLPAEEAKALLQAEGRREAADLLGNDGGGFSGYQCGSLIDTWYGPLAPSTGYIRLFKLHYYLPDFLLMIPYAASPAKIPAFAEFPKLSAVYNQSTEWEKLIGVTCMADLNRTMRAGNGRDLVRMCEAWHDKKIAQIAEKIVEDKRRVILIAGPSSSGKTTFAHRLTVHLHSHGLQPLALSLDDYYLNRDICPKDENGKYDLESINSLDIPLFEEQVSALLSGEAVELAKFNFMTGISGRSGQRIAVKAGQPLIIEGINGLNDKLTRFIPVGTKFRIFASALTQLNIDDHNRVATTDVRLIRRMVRDHLYRGHKADKTIETWPSVHDAEFKNIFPYQENADMIFNSALVYELAALRTVALPLLAAIEADSPSRLEADRLAAFLSLVEPLPCTDEIPPISIIREFIGGCTFYIE